MLRLENSSQQNPSLWETVLPPELFQMNEELTRVDKLLDDERFINPFRERFGTRMGRPTTAVSTHTRKAKKVYLGLMKVMKARGDKDRAAFKSVQEELVKIAGEAIAGGRGVQAELELLPEKPPLVNTLREQLGEWIEVAEKVVWQTQEVIKRNRNISRRLVSLFDVDARPIKGGKSRADTEFGRKVLLGETDHGITTTYNVLEENPYDTALLKPAARGRRRLFRKRLKAVATDRGFYSETNEDWLKGGGVKQASIPSHQVVAKMRKGIADQ